MKRIMMIVLGLFLAIGTIAQGVKVGTTNNDPDASAAFEVESSTKGFLPPRMSTEERDAIAQPVAIGLQIYNTTTNCINVYTGSSWKQICPECEFSPPAVTSNAPVCEGETLQLTASFISGAAYAWTGPNGFSSNEQNPQIENATLQYTGNYSVIATVNGCSSAPVTTYVNFSSTQAATASSNSPLCEGDILYLTASTISGATYAWTGPNGFTSPLQNPEIPNVLPTHAGIYTVTPTVNGCVGAASTVIVSITAGGVSTFIFDQEYPTPNNPVTFTPNVAGNTYSWSFEDGSPISSSAETPSVTWATAGYHNVQLVATKNGCSTTTTISLYVYTPVTFNYTGSEQTFTVPEGISSVFIEAFGAEGGTKTYMGTDYGAGGLGGKASGTLSVTPNEELKIYVGQRPTNYIGGWNGGGSSGNSSYGETRGGGGASDVRQGASALTNRKIVAGGGGSSCGTNHDGGVGGGLTGGETTGQICCGGSWTGAGGGTQTEGGYNGTGSGTPDLGASSGQVGQLGIGGNGGSIYGGGGGGGYYGGGGGAGTKQGMGYCSAGGGGSSYIGGVTNGSTTAGLNSGHGKVIIYW